MPRDLTDAERQALLADVRAELGLPASELREWCKCDSCWGWFVEDHPGEDLDDLGRDRSWWSGLPVHRDAPSGAVSQGLVGGAPDVR